MTEDISFFTCTLMDAAEQKPGLDIQPYPTIRATHNALLENSQRYRKLFNTLIKQQADYTSALKKTNEPLENKSLSWVFSVAKSAPNFIFRLLPAQIAVDTTVSRMHRIYRQTTI